MQYIFAKKLKVLFFGFRMHQYIKALHFFSIYFRSSKMIVKYVDIYKVYAVYW